ncbi:MAG: RHS repeat-associated core domain-containing protein [Chloroflexi bacterium]|nr:RHS repeat-associated core domain-containing protein [Chloroflexota bacterium]
MILHVWGRSSSGTATLRVWVKNTQIQGTYADQSFTLGTTWTHCQIAVSDAAVGQACEVRLSSTSGTVYADDVSITCEGGKPPEGATVGGWAQAVAGPGDWPSRPAGLAAPVATRSAQQQPVIVTKYRCDCLSRGAGLAAPPACPLAQQPSVVIKYYVFNGQRVALRRDGVLYFLHTDHLGSTSLLTDQDGNEVSNSRLSYYPYGSVRSGDPAALPTEVNFTGQRLDRGTGLLYYGARYYDPLLGRFISADTVVPGAGNPQALNRFSYVLNNPLRYTDPLGHIPCYGDPSRGECSWSGTGHHQASQQGRRQDIATYTSFVLREVRNPAAGIDDVEAFAQVLSFAAGFATSTQEWADDISSVILGADGPFALVTAVPVAAQRWLGGKDRLPGFGDSGFNPVYQDGQNQPYHWWAYVNTTVQGGWAGAILVGGPGNFVHEFLDPTESLKPPAKRGASWQDYALSYNGMAFGLLLGATVFDRHLAGLGDQLGAQARHEKEAPQGLWQGMNGGRLNQPDPPGPGSRA